MPAAKKFLPRLLIYTMSLSLSPPHLLTCSSPLLSLSLSLSRSPSVIAPATIPCRGYSPAVRRLGGRSNDQPMPCAAAAPLRLPPRVGAIATTMRRHCGAQRSRGSPPTPLAAEVFLQASYPRCVATYFSSTSPWATSRLGAHRHAHHWRMGTAMLLASRGGMTPPPSTPS
jgi:hypothetical protein